MITRDAVPSRYSERSISAILAFALLAFQAAIPWTAGNFITQDGPSHLYTAVVAKDLLLHRNSPYAAVYTLQSKLITNWSTTVVLNVLASVFGAKHAEQALSTLCIVFGFFAISYLRRSLEPRLSPWSPVTNFLLNTWFLWIGFYNFYLGMALCALLVGFAIRHIRAMTRLRMIALAVGLVVLFFTHVLSLSLALMAIGLVAVWGRSWPPVYRIATAMAPAVVLLAVFLAASSQNTAFQPRIEAALESFPMHVFASARGRLGEEILLYPAMLFYVVVGMAVMRHREWTTARGALAVAALSSFLLYLIIPNEGFGGDEIKIRFAWGVFVFGAVVAASAYRLQVMNIALSVYITFFSIATLVSAMHHNVQNVSRAATAYAAALSAMPEGSTFIRLRYPTELTRRKYGYDLVALEPMLHAEAWVAAQRKLIDLSDYQAMSQLFPVVYKPFVSGVHQRALWALEGIGPDGGELIEALRKDFPVKIDYVVVVGDTLSEPESNLHPVSTSGANPFVRVYQASDYFRR